MTAAARRLYGGSVAALLEAGLCCPRCKSDLTDRTVAGDPEGYGGSLDCAACNASYPVLCGIPDLRVAPDPYIGIEADRAKGQRLAAHPTRDWRELAALYYDITLDTVPPRQARQFAAGLEAAEPRAQAVLDAWTAIDNTSLGADDRLLDVGCGTAPLLVAVGKQQPTRRGVTIGVDVAFRWLVVGQARLRNAGVKAHLVCACAEALPFRSQRFDVVASQGTLENVRSAATALRETRRVLTKGGRCWISTANRLSLGPDPHLGLPAGGYLSDDAAAAVARRRGALPPVRRLLSRGDVATLLREQGFSDQRYGTPSIPEAQRRAAGPVVGAGIHVYEFLRRTPILRDTLLLVGPTLLATALSDA